MEVKQQVCIERGLIEITTDENPSFHVNLGHLRRLTKQAKRYQRKHSKSERYTALVSFIGPTGGGKSFLGSEFGKHIGVNEKNLPLARGKHEDHFVGGKTADVNHYLFMPSDANFPIVRLFDCEGSGALLPQPLFQNMTTEFFNLLKSTDIEKRRGKFVDTYIPRLAYVLSDILVYISKNDLGVRELQEHIENLVHTAQLRVEAGRKPVLFVVCNQLTRGPFSKAATQKFVEDLYRLQPDLKTLLEQGFTKVFFFRLPFEDIKRQEYQIEMKRLMDNLSQACKRAANSQAQALQEIEKRTGYPTHRLFDFLGGTSAGGLAAVSLGILKMPAAKLVKHFHDFPEKVFVPKILPGWFLNMFGRSRYDSDKLKKALHEVLHETGHASWLSLVNRAFPKVFVTCKVTDKTSTRSVLFGNYFSVSDIFMKTLRYARPLYEVKCQETVMTGLLATTSAPTYFSRVELAERYIDAAMPKSEPLMAMDGGVGNELNNPVIIGINEATLHCGTYPDIVVSVGTGLHTSAAFSNGLADTIKMMIGEAGNSETPNQLLHMMQNSRPESKVFRLNPDELGGYSLDAHEERDLNKIQALGESFIRKNENDFAELSALLLVKSFYLDGVATKDKSLYVSLKARLCELSEFEFTVGRMPDSNGNCNVSMKNDILRIFGDPGEHSIFVKGRAKLTGSISCRVEEYLHISGSPFKVKIDSAMKISIAPVAACRTESRDEEKDSDDDQTGESTADSDDLDSRKHEEEDNDDEKNDGVSNEEEKGDTELSDAEEVGSPQYVSDEETKRPQASQPFPLVQPAQPKSTVHSSVKAVCTAFLEDKNLIKFLTGLGIKDPVILAEKLSSQEADTPTVIALMTTQDIAALDLKMGSRLSLQSGVECLRGLTQ